MDKCIDKMPITLRTFKLLYLLMLVQGLEYDNLVELECIHSAATSVLSPAELYQMSSRIEWLWQQYSVTPKRVHHIQEYHNYLFRIFQFVYTGQMESPDEWVEFAKEIDRRRSEFSSREYEKLIYYMHFYSPEVENAVYRQLGREDLVRPSARYLLSVTSDILNLDLQDLYTAQDNVKGLGRELLSVKIEFAHNNGIANDAEYETLVSRLNALTSA